MEAILDWGLGVIRAVQTAASPVLTVVMRGVTELGSEYFYIIALAAVFWCVDERRGARLGIVVLFSTFLNGWIKGLVSLPRPFLRDPSVGIGTEEGWSLPSGHAQGSATFWTMAAGLFRKPWGLVLAIGMPTLIGFTRVYLGVHYPTDVLAGWAVGYAIAIPAALLAPKVEEWLLSVNPRVSMVLVTAVALGMNALSPAHADSSGAFFGLGIGLVVARFRAPFSASGKPVEKLLRFLVGMAGVAAIYFGLKIAEGPLADLGRQSVGEIGTLLRFLRYALVGFWASFGAPICFVAMGLARVHESERIPEALEDPAEAEDDSRE